jgi:hypothetical protein
MAIKALAWMVRIFEPPVSCYHEIVHNRSVVERFERLGVIFVDRIDEVPEGAPLMLSAHGTAPQVVEAARDKGRVVVNAACPLVTKVHQGVKVRARKGYTVIYAGHEGHQEAVGTMAVAPQSVRLVESPEDVIALDDVEGPVAFLTQTTLSLADWQGVLDATRERFPDVWVPGKPRGRDIRRKKKSLPVVFALGRTSGRRRPVAASLFRTRGTERRPGGRRPGGARRLRRPGLQHGPSRVPRRAGPGRPDPSRREPGSLAGQSVPDRSGGAHRVRHAAKLLTWPVCPWRQL